MAEEEAAPVDEKEAAKGAEEKELVEALLALEALRQKLWVSSFSFTIKRSRACGVERGCSRQGGSGKKDELRAGEIEIGTGYRRARASYLDRERSPERGAWPGQVLRAAAGFSQPPRRRRRPDSSGVVSPSQRVAAWHGRGPKSRWAEADPLVSVPKQESKHLRRGLHGERCESGVPHGPRGPAFCAVGITTSASGWARAAPGRGRRGGAIGAVENRPHGRKVLPSGAVPLPLNAEGLRGAQHGRDLSVDSRRGVRAPGWKSPRF